MEATSGPNRVGDVMTREPVLVDAEASASDAERLIKTHHVSGLPVVSDDEVVGVISQTDLVVARSSAMTSANWDRLRVRHLMAAPAVTVQVGTPVRRASRLMAERHIHRLVVVDEENRPVGVVSAFDLLALVASGARSEYTDRELAGARSTFGTRLTEPIDEARSRVETALEAEGFGVLTEIDVAATLRRKLGIDRAPYLILGACNPSLASRALEADESIGALLPCNVVLRGDGGETVVEVMDPRAAMKLAGAPAVAAVAEEARRRLERVVAALAD